MSFGGPVFWILAVMSVIAVVIFFERLFELRRMSIDGDDFVRGVINVLSRGGEDEALAICADTRSSISSVVSAAIRNRRSSVAVLRGAVDAQGRAEVGRLDRRLASLAIIGQIAPIVGLFGAVVGFMRTVQAANLNVVVSRPELMSDAMGALVPTAFGLALAVVVSVLYGILRIRLERIVVELEAVASQIVGYLTDAGGAR